MGGDVDVFVIKLAQLVYGAEEAIDACALEWREHLKGERGVRTCCYGIYDAHCCVSCVMSWLKVGIRPCRVSLRPSVRQGR